MSAFSNDREISESIESLQAIIEPTLIGIMGAILGWLFSRWLGPLYDTISEAQDIESCTIRLRHGHALECYRTSARLALTATFRHPATCRWIGQP